MASENLLCKSFVCKAKIIEWTNCATFSDRLDERAKNSNLQQPTGKPFSSLPRFSNRPKNLEKKRVDEPTKFDTTENLLAHIATFSLKNRNDNFRIILKGVKEKE